MKKLSIFLIFSHVFVSLICFDFRVGQQGGKQATLDRFDGTCGKRNLPVVVDCQGIRSEGGKIHIKASITVKEEFTAAPLVSIKVERCKSKENLDTCQHFHEYKIENVCDTYNSDLFMWKSFYESFQPKLACPMKKGVYRSNDSVIDPLMFLIMFPQESWFWKGKIEVREKQTNRLCMCIMAEARLTMS